MKTIRAVLSSISHSPGKSILTIITVGLGVGVLILALSISFLFEKIMDEEMNGNGTIITLMNGELNTEGEMEQARPPQFDENVTAILESDVSGVVAASPIVSPRWRDIQVNGVSYQARSVMGVSEDYFSMTGLKLIVGNFFTKGDEDSGTRKAVITESTAEILYGSPEDAIGKVLEPPLFRFRRADASENAATPPAQVFTVVGVIHDPSDMMRKAYGVGDIFIPYTTAFPMPLDNAFARRMLMTTQVVKIEGGSVQRAESQIREVLTRQYGDDLTLSVWEGTPSGETAWLEQTRKTVSMFNLVVNLLGFVLLVIGSIGILSIMLVEVLNKSREIALERAFGASKLDIVKEFFVRSLIFSFFSVLLGIVLALVFADPLQIVLEPILQGIGISQVTGNVITPLAILVGTVSALIVGGIFGVLPVFSALKTSISDGIRGV